MLKRIKASKYALTAFLLPIAVCILMFIEKGVYPFGSGTILKSDAAQQYYPFLYEFANKITSGGLSEYNWNLGLGSDMVATYAYYLASPFNWLLLVWPKGLIVEFMTYSIVLRIGLSSLAFYKLLNYRYELVEDKNKFAAIAFSVAYAMSGYVAAYNWHIMWLDCIVLAPVIIMGLLKMQREKKSALYYVSLSVAIISNYYIALMICIFVGIYGVWLFIENKENRTGFVLRFVSFSLLAGATGAFLILPTITVLSASGSDVSSFPDSIKFYFNIWEEISRMNAFDKVYLGDNKWPNIYAGAFTLLLLMLYAFNREISLKKKLPRLMTVAFFLLSFMVNVLDFLWHGLRFPTWFPCRQSFLYVLVVLMLAFEAFLKRASLKKRDWLIAGFVWCVIITICYFNTASEIISGSSYWLTATLIIFYIGMNFLSAVVDKDTKKFVGRLTFVVAVLEIVLSMRSSSFSVMNRNEYLNLGEIKAQAVALIEDDSFYRVENLSATSKNDGCFGNYKSASTFNTMMNMSVADFYHKNGLLSSNKYYSYIGATPLISAMLNVKYVISEEEFKTPSLRKLVGSTENMYVYENKYCLPVGFMVGDEKVSNFLVYVVDSDLHYNEASITMTAPEDGLFYVQYYDCKVGSFTVSDSYGNEKIYIDTVNPHAIELGMAQKGDVFTINTDKIGAINLYRLDMTALTRSYEVMRENSMENVKFTNNSIKGSIVAKKAGQLVFSIPADKGWSIYVDGKMVDSETYDNTFLAANISAGNHIIELNYSTPYLGIGIIISCMSVIMSIILLKILQYINI